MDNVINFEDYKKKNKGGFAPVTVEEQRETNRRTKTRQEETKKTNTRDDDG